MFCVSLVDNLHTKSFVDATNIFDTNGGIICTSFEASTLYKSLPCGYIGDWHGIKAKDLINTIVESRIELYTNPQMYKTKNNSNVIGYALKFLRECTNLFIAYPDKLVYVDF